MSGYDYYSGHCEERIREERHRVPSICEDNAGCWREEKDSAASDAHVVTDVAPGNVAGTYRTEVFMRRQELLSEIASQHSRSSLSTDERDYLSRLSTTISTLNVESIASIDVLKLCIVCSRFFPRVDIRGELSLLKSGIEAFLRIRTI